MTIPAPEGKLPLDDWFTVDKEIEHLFYDGDILPPLADELGGENEPDPTERLNNDQTYRNDFLDNLANHQYVKSQPKEKPLPMHEQLYRMATANGGSWTQGGSENLHGSGDASGHGWQSGVGR
tara:strand:- start:672 stop:1040 length:369 start_codon:yes stop_codon:yes gene_type:complete